MFSLLIFFISFSHRANPSFVPSSCVGWAFFLPCPQLFQINEEKETEPSTPLPSPP